MQLEQSFSLWETLGELVLSYMVSMRVKANTPIARLYMNYFYFKKYIIWVKRLKYDLGCTYHDGRNYVF